MRTIMLLGLFVLLSAGCLGPTEAQPEETPAPGPVPEPSVTCTTVSELVPFEEEQCSNLTVFEPVCERKELNFSTIKLEPVHLCSSDGACTGKPLNECFTCSKAMTRCRLVVTNLDEDKPGVWKAGANFSIGNAGFIKESVSSMIGPGENYTFDFFQIYTPENLRIPASCEVFIIDIPEVEVCKDVIHTQEECLNVTKYKTVDKQVCQ